MQIKKEMWIEWNYEVIKCDNSTATSIVLEFLCLDFNKKNFNLVFEKLSHRLDNEFKKAYLEALKSERIRNLYHRELKVWTWHNLVPSILRNSLASLISWTTVTPTFKANYIALWADSTAPTNADVQLGNETYRGAITNRYSIENVAYLDKFFSTPEVAWQTFLEIWVFVDGSNTPNSWFLLSRININETMWPSETLSINATFTILG